MQSDHLRLDGRSLAMHRLIVKRIRQNPALLDKARTTLAHWQTMHPEMVCNHEWADWLDRPLDETLAFMVDESETATRLRQSSPFCGVLTNQERRQFIESHSARAYYSRRQRDSR